VVDFEDFDFMQVIDELYVQYTQMPAACELLSDTHV